VMESLAGLEERWAALCIALKLSSEEAFELFEAFRFSSARMGQLKAAVNVNQQMSDFIASYPLEGSAELPLSSEREHKLYRSWMEAILDNGKAAAGCWLQAAAVSLINRIELDKLENWLNTMTVSSVRELAIGGADVLRLLKKSTGPWLGQLLNELVREVAFGELSNDRDSLLAAVSRRHAY
jgi:tRNA nucleotidyltransferase (CCA-adding enzyme)